MVWIAVALLGGAGGVLRLVVDAVVSQRAGGRFPLGTLTVNLTGAFALGVLTGITLEGDALLLADTALIGSYTTFSTWVFESHRLGEEGQTGQLWLNVSASLIAGLAATAIGRAIGGAL